LVFAESQTRGRGRVAGVGSPRGKDFGFRFVATGVADERGQRITVRRVCGGAAIRQNCAWTARSSAE